MVGVTDVELGEGEHVVSLGADHQCLIAYTGPGHSTHLDASRNCLYVVDNNERGG